MATQKEHYQLSSKRALAILLTTSIGLSLLTGCTQQPTRSAVSFESLCGLTLEEFEALDEDALLQWIEQTYGASPEKHNTGPWDLPGVTYEWKDSRFDGSAYVRDGVVVEIYLDLKSGPSLGEVVDNLDAPAAVRGHLLIAYDALPGYSVALYYPTKGLSVLVSSWKDHSSMVLSGESYWEDWTVTLHEWMPVNLVICYRPRPSAEDVWRNVHHYSEEIIQTQMEPWPGFGVRIPLR